MAIARRLTDNSWILENKFAEKIGLLSFDNSTTKYQLITPTTMLYASDVSEYYGICEDTVIQFEERVQASVDYNDIDGYLVHHEITNNIEHCSNGIIKYTYKSKDKIYFAGYWCTPTGTNTSTWYVRVSISEDVYNNYIQLGITPLGPFKDKLNALYAVKQGEYACKNGPIQNPQ
jgi:hypothetical protein